MEKDVEFREAVDLLNILSLLSDIMEPHADEASGFNWTWCGCWCTWGCRRSTSDGLLLAFDVGGGCVTKGFLPTRFLRNCSIRHRREVALPSIDVFIDIISGTFSALLVDDPKVCC